MPRTADSPDHASCRYCGSGTAGSVGGNPTYLGGFEALASFLKIQLTLRSTPYISRSNRFCLSSFSLSAAAVASHFPLPLAVYVVSHRCIAVAVVVVASHFPLATIGSHCSWEEEDRCHRHHQRGSTSIPLGRLEGLTAP